MIACFQYTWSTKSGAPAPQSHSAEERQQCISVVGWCSIAHLRQFVKCFRRRVFYLSSGPPGVSTVGERLHHSEINSQNDQITHFRSCPSTPVVSHRSLGLSSPVSQEFFRSGQRSPSRIPCPFTSLALAKAASRSTRSFSLVCFDSGSIAYFRRAVKGFRPFFCGGRKTRSTRRFHHRLPTPPAFQWSCPILKKTTKSQRVGFTPGNSDFWIVGFHQRWPP